MEDRPISSRKKKKPTSLDLKMSKKPEELFHKLVTDHLDTVLQKLGEHIPFSNLAPTSSELYRKKIPDFVLESRDPNQPAMAILELKLRVQEDDLLTANVYKAVVMEKVGEKLPLHRKLHEASELTMVVIFSILRPNSPEIRKFCHNHDLKLLTIEEGLDLDIKRAEYTTVGAPLVLAVICYKKLQGNKEWKDDLIAALTIFKDSPDEFNFLTSYGNYTLVDEEDLRTWFLNKMVEATGMSNLEVLTKLIKDHRLPPEETEIILASLKGLSEEQKQVILASLKGLSEEQKQVILASLKGLSEEQKQVILASLKGLSKTKFQKILEIIQSDE